MFQRNNSVRGLQNEEVSSTFSLRSRQEQSLISVKRTKEEEDSSANIKEVYAAFLLLVRHFSSSYFLGSKVYYASA